MDAQVKLKPNLEIIREEEIPHILEAGEVGAVLELIVQDKDGKVTDYRVMRSKSFVRQFLELLWIQTFQIPVIVTYSVLDTGNVLRSIVESGLVFACNAAAGVVTCGTRAGTGIIAPAIGDYALGTPIAQGIAAGQLDHSAVTFGAPASDATTSQFTVTRNFANASGASITVNELGLYVKAYDSAFVEQYFLAIRDVIAGGIAVPNGQTLTVNYRLQAVI